MRHDIPPSHCSRTPRSVSSTNRGRRSGLIGGGGAFLFVQRCRIGRDGLKSFPLDRPRRLRLQGLYDRFTPDLVDDAGRGGVVEAHSAD